MKIVMLLGYDILFPKLDKRVYMESKTLADNHHEVLVICWPRRITNLPRYEEYNKINIVRIEQKMLGRKTSFIRKLPQYFQLLIKMVNEVKIIQPDILFCHDLEMLPIGVIGKLKLKIPLIYDSHENWPAMETNTSKIIGLVTNFVEKVCLLFVTHVLTISDSLALKFKSLNKQTTVLLTSRSKDEIQNLSFTDKNVIRSELQISPTDFVFGYIGALEGKNIELLLDTMEYIYRKEHTTYMKLLIIGGPKEVVNHLQKKANEYESSNCIKILHYIDFNEIHNYFNILDIGVVQYVTTFQSHIAIPGKLLDYLAFGIPPIARNFYERAKIVKEARCGLIFNRESCGEMGDLLLRLSNFKYLDKLRVNAKEAFISNYCWELQEIKLLDTVKKVVT